MKAFIRAVALLTISVFVTHLSAQEIDEVVVYSNPFSKSIDEVISTVDILDEDEIDISSDLPLGSILVKLPGLDSSGYGPSVGQPIIRGQGGFRVGVLNNGMSTGDVAYTGNDHSNGVPIQNLERIEVLKGPAALRYGPYSSSGVINSFNKLMSSGENETNLKLGYGDSAQENSASLFTRMGNFAFSAYYDDADNMRIPTHAESVAQLQSEGEEIPADRSQDAENTFGENQGISFGGNFGNDITTISILFAGDDKTYGVPGHAHGEDHDGEDHDGEDHGEEESIKIDSEHRTFQAQLNHDLSGNLINSIRADLSHSAFEQEEMEGAELGIKYEQDESNFRLEASANLGNWQTTFGSNFRDMDLKVIPGSHDDDDDDGHGHGQYLPESDRSEIGLFFLSQLDNENWLIELAGRYDSIEQEAFKEEHDDDEDDDGDGDGDGDGDHGDDDHESHGSIDHNLTNVSVGLAKKLGGGLLLGGSLSHTERAPSQVELFAGGKHVAAQREEFGDEDLNKEKSLSTELYLRKRWDKSSFKLSTFINDYEDFIYLQKRAGTEDEFDFLQQDAEISGLEASFDTAINIFGYETDALISYSLIEGELDNGQNLPRIPPEKYTICLKSRVGETFINFDLIHSAKQNDVALNELSTDSFTQVDLGLDWTPSAFNGLKLSAVIRNLTDEEIRRHTSALKDLLPESGRDIRLSIGFSF
jgi:iron complex outermembrane receptor protein